MPRTVKGTQEDSELLLPKNPDACDVDVVIVGAGLSGLCAAKYLSERNVSVLVLEARDRVGGRTYTIQDEEHGWVDLGASYVGDAHTNLLKLAEQLGVKTYNVYLEGKSTFYFKGKGQSYEGVFPNTNPIEWLDVNNMFRELDRLSEQMPRRAPWTCPNAKMLDNMTMQEWLNKVCWTRAARDWGRYAVHAGATMEPCEVSVLWFLWNIRPAEGIASIRQLADITMGMKFAGGSQQISERLADILKGRVHLSSPVAKITQNKDGAAVTTVDGKMYKAKFVISTMAPHLQQKIHHDPPLPIKHNQLIQRLPMGSCIKAKIWYKRPFWRDQGLSGLGLTGDETFQVSEVVDDTMADGKHPALTGFITGQIAREVGEWSLDERKKTVMQACSKYFEDDEALEAMHYMDYNWSAEEYTGGAFTNSYPPGALTTFHFDASKPFERMFFAGSENAVQWAGYMEGAVTAGERAAREVLHVMGSIAAEDVWPALDKVESPFSEPWWVKHAPSIGGLIHGSCVAAAGICLLATSLLFVY